MKCTHLLDQIHDFLEHAIFLFSNPVVWTDHTSYAPSAKNDEIKAIGLSLDPGGHYRIAVKFCVSDACSLPVYTTGVTILIRPLTTGRAVVDHSNATGVSVVRKKMFIVGTTKPVLITYL